MFKINHLKLISFILLFSLFTSMLFSCDKRQQAGDDSANSASNTSELETLPSFSPLTILEDGKTNLTLLMPLNASQDQRDLILYFRKEFEKRTDINIPITYEKKGDSPENDNFEILIGKSLRKESTELSSSMRKMDYCYTVCGNKLVFAGGSISAVKHGVQYFIRKFLDSALQKDSKNVVFTPDDSYYEIIKYHIQEFLIDGVDAYNYKIVYSTRDLLSAQAFAHNLAKTITQKYGYTLKVVPDTQPESDYEIIVGDTSRGHPNTKEKSFDIFCNDKKLYFYCDTSTGYEYFFDYVDQTVLSGSKQLNIENSFKKTVPLSDVLSGGSENILSRSGDIRIFFNNVWSGNTSDAPASIRAEYIKEMIYDYAPDIVCLQEYSGAVKNALSVHLTKLGYVELKYEERNKSHDVRTPVYYNPKTVLPVDSGFWAFNDTANDKSKSIGWGVFMDKSGNRFCVASTHFYWTSDELGEYARKIDATELCEQMKKVSQKHNDIPVIIGGDYNCRLGSDPLEILKSNGFTDVESTAIKTELNGTHHSYPTIDSSTLVCTNYSKASGTNENAIDHVFSYSDKNLTVNLYDVIEDYLALASSDHCPMLVDITLKQPR